MHPARWRAGRLKRRQAGRKAGREAGKKAGKQSGRQSGSRNENNTFTRIALVPRPCSTLGSNHIPHKVADRQAGRQGGKQQQIYTR